MFLLMIMLIGHTLATSHRYVGTSVETNNSLFEYSNNRRPNNDIRIRIRSFLKYWIIFEYSNNKLRITNNQFQYFNFEFNPFLYGNWMKNWVNVCRYQFISNSHIVIQEILFLMVRESRDIWVLGFYLAKIITKTSFYLQNHQNLLRVWFEGP